MYIELTLFLAKISHDFLQRNQPIHKLKIDQSFVHNITTDPDDAAIINAVIELSHGLKLKSSPRAWKPKNSVPSCTRGCDEMQGYLFSRPVPAEEMGALLIANQQLLAGRMDRQ